MDFPSDFDHRVRASKERRMLSSEIISIDVEMGEGQTEENVVFTWDIETVNNYRLDILMYFDNVLAISANQEVDKIHVSFNESKYFKSVENKSEIEEDSEVIETIPT